MCMTAVLAGASLIGGLAQAGAAKKAAAAQERSADKQIALNKEIYEDQTQRFAPFLGAGTNALKGYQFEMGLGAAPDGYRGFQETPGYQFQRQQGIGAIDASAAARGNLLSGSTLKGLTEFGQGLASQEYGNYLNRLAGLASSGQNAAGMQAAAGNTYAQNTGNALASIGNAQAAGAIGTGNAISGITDNLTSALMFKQLMQ